MMTRPSREFAVAHGAQLSAERLLGDDDAELLEDPLRQIDQPPAHHAMDRRDRARIDPGHQGRAMRVGELGRLAGGLRLINPSGPWALNFTTQSRTI